MQTIDSKYNETKTACSANTSRYCSEGSLRSSSAVYKCCAKMTHEIFGKQQIRKHAQHCIAAACYSAQQCKIRHAAFQNTHIVTSSRWKAFIPMKGNCKNLSGSSEENGKQKPSMIS
jgi:hypothetical protein